MKTNNKIVLIVSALLAAFLLLLWFYLGFNQVDSPLDLLIAILWWVIIAALVGCVMGLERRRERQVRTIYVTPTGLFNSERGMVVLGEGAAVPAVAEGILKELKYGFSSEDMPKLEDFDCRFVVQSDEYKAADSEDGEPVWKGTVVKIDRANGNKETPFSTREELIAALA